MQTPLAHENAPVSSSGPSSRRKVFLGLGLTMLVMTIAVVGLSASPSGLQAAPEMLVQTS